MPKPHVDHENVNSKNHLLPIKSASPLIVPPRVNCNFHIQLKTAVFQTGDSREDQPEGRQIIARVRKPLV